MEVEVDGRWEKGIGLVRMTEGNMFETVLKVKIELNLKSSLNNIYNLFLGTVGSSTMPGVQAKIVYNMITAPPLPILLELSNI